MANDQLAFGFGSKKHMMEKLRELQVKILSLFRTGGKELRQVQPIQPVRDWKILLAVEALGVLVAALFAGYVYFEIKTPDPIAGGETKKSIKLSSEAMAEVLKKAEARALTHQQLKNAAPSSVDPSR